MRISLELEYQYVGDNVFGHSTVVSVCYCDGRTVSEWLYVGTVLFGFHFHVVAGCAGVWGDEICLKG